MASDGNEAISHATRALDLGIVMPLYNKQATVVRAIRSLFAQTIKPRRIVVVDDGSTDGSLGEILPYRHLITIVNQSNAGPSAARNRGLQELDTQWVGFADADNCWHPGRVEAVQRMIERSPDLDWLTGRYYRITPEGNRSTLPPVRESSGTAGDVVDYFQWTATGISGVHASETLVSKRCLLQDVGGFDQSLRCHEITMMYLSLAVRSPRVGIVGPPTVDIYFDRADSLYSNLKDSSSAMLSYGKALVGLSQRSGAHRTLIRAKAAETLRTALWLALQDGSLSVSREIIFTYGEHLGLRALWKGRVRFAWQALSARRVARRQTA